MFDYAESFNFGEFVPMVAWNYKCLNHLVSIPNHGMFYMSFESKLQKSTIVNKGDFKYNDL
jgi:hypothetical protein